jgi:hypothetical protein
MIIGHISSGSVQPLVPLPSIAAPIHRLSYARTLCPRSRWAPQWVSVFCGDLHDPLRCFTPPSLACWYLEGLGLVFCSCWLFSLSPVLCWVVLCSLQHYFDLLSLQYICILLINANLLIYIYIYILWGSRGDKWKRVCPLSETMSKCVGKSILRAWAGCACRHIYVLHNQHCLLRRAYVIIMGSRVLRLEIEPRTIRLPYGKYIELLVHDQNTQGFDMLNADMRWHADGRNGDAWDGLKW